MNILSMKTKFIILLLSLFYNLNVHAQVTVGTDEAPEKAALLQIKDQSADANNVTATQGGFLLPRVQLVQSNELIPFIASATQQERKLHEGLIVYNLTDNPDNGLEVGINYWDGEKWNLLSVGKTKEASYTIADCEAIKITGGDLTVGVPLTAANTMVITLSVTKPGAYNIMAKPETDNGYYFRASGEFQLTGTFEVIAVGVGSPIESRNPDDASLPAGQQLFDQVSVSLNGNASGCTKDIKVLGSKPVIAQKRMVVFGDTTYGFTSGGAFGAQALLTDNMNYGTNENSIVKYEGFSGNLQTETAMSDTNIKKYTGADGSTPYDIIMITYNIIPSEAQMSYLRKYVDKNGVLIFFSERPISSTAMIDSIFDAKLTNANIVDMSTSIYQLNKISDIDDEITNGPFGDVRGLAWGCDVANTLGLTTLPENAIVYSSNINAATNQPATGTQANVKATMLRHQTKNFFWCGDGGFVHGGTGTSATEIPLWVGSVNKTINGVSVNYPKYPVAKSNYGSNAASKTNVYNSVLFANIMAWGLRMAETNGINTP